MRDGAWRGAAALAAVAALIVAGCGGGGSDEGSPTPNKSSSKAPTGAKAGGDLKVAFAGDVDWLDPRMTYYQYGFFVTYAIQRPLYSFKPDDAKTPVPDLASGPPEISSDGKTVTVKIRPGIKYSPPVNRVVTTKDVAYAMESGVQAERAERLRRAYMGRLDGPEGVQGRQGEAHRGHPDARRHDDRLQPRPPARRHLRRRPRPARLGAGARGLREAVRQRQGRHIDLRQHQVVSTGPYMVKTLVGSSPATAESRSSSSATRTGTKSTDYKPAYADSITINEGSDPDVARRQILQGQNMISGDFQLPAQILASGVEERRTEGPDGHHPADGPLPLHRAQQHA